MFPIFPNSKYTISTDVSMSALFVSGGKVTGPGTFSFFGLAVVFLTPVVGGLSKLIQSGPC